MSEELRGLIEKIQQEGVQAAKDKARAIEEEASLRSREIIETAQLQADKLLKEAKDKIKQTEEASSVRLTQAGRDMLISLRGELNAILKSIILREIRASLSPSELAAILSALIRNYNAEAHPDIVVLLNKEDMEKLEREFLAKLKEELKKPLTLKASEDIQAGFMISYDAGKSCYDFTDTALADYLSAHLEPRLAGFLKTTTTKEK